MIPLPRGEKKKHGSRTALKKKKLEEDEEVDSFTSSTSSTTKQQDHRANIVTKSPSVTFVEGSMASSSPCVRAASPTREMMSFSHGPVSPRQSSPRATQQRPSSPLPPGISPPRYCSSDLNLDGSSSAHMQAYAVIETLKMKLPWFESNFLAPPPLPSSSPPCPSPPRHHTATPPLSPSPSPPFTSLPSSPSLSQISSSPSYACSLSSLNRLDEHREENDAFKAIVEVITALQARKNADVVGAYGPLFLDRNKLWKVFLRKSEIEKVILKTLQASTLVATKIGRQNRFPRIPSEEEHNQIFGGPSNNTSPSLFVSAVKAFREEMLQTTEIIFNEILIQELFPPQLATFFSSLKSSIEGQKRKGEADQHVVNHYTSLGPSSTLFLSIKYRIEDAVQQAQLVGAKMVSLLTHLQSVSPDNQSRENPSPPPSPHSPTSSPRRSPPVRPMRRRRSTVNMNEKGEHLPPPPQSLPPQQLPTNIEQPQDQKQPHCPPLPLTPPPPATPPHMPGPSIPNLKIPQGKPLDLNIAIIQLLLYLYDIMSAVTTLYDDIATFRGLSFRHTTQIPKNVLDILNGRGGKGGDVDVWETAREGQEGGSASSTGPSAPSGPNALSGGEKRKKSESERRIEKEQKKEKEKDRKDKDRMEKQREKERKKEARGGRGVGVGGGEAENSDLDLSEATSLSRTASTTTPRDSHDDDITAVPETLPTLITEMIGKVGSQPTDPTSNTPPNPTRIPIRPSSSGNSSPLLSSNSPSSPLASPLRDSGDGIAGEGETEGETEGEREGEKEGERAADAIKESRNRNKRAKKKKSRSVIMEDSSDGSDKIKRRKSRGKRQSLRDREEDEVEEREREVEGEGKEEGEGEEKRKGEGEGEKKRKEETKGEDEQKEGQENEQRTESEPKKSPKPEPKKTESTSSAPTSINSPITPRGLRRANTSGQLNQKKKLSHKKHRSTTTRFEKIRVPSGVQGEVGRTSSGGDVSKEESPSKFALKGPAIPRLSLVVGGSKEEDLGSGSKTTRRGGNRKNFAQNFLTFRKRNTRGAADDMSALMMPLVVSVSEVSETSVLFAVTTASSVVSFRVRIRISDTTKKKGGEDGEGNGGQWKWYNRDTQELVDSTKEGGKTKLLEDVAPSEDETLSCFDYPGSRDAVPVGGLKGGVGYEVLIIGRTQRGESIHSPTVFFMTVEKKKEEDRGGGGEEGENCGKTMERRKSKRNLTKTFSKKELVKMKKDLDTEEDEGGAVDGIGGEGGDRGVPEVTGVQKILMTAKEDRERLGEHGVMIRQINKLVIFLTNPESYDINFMRLFFVVYSSFTTADQLLTKLLQRYRVPEGVLTQKNLDAVQIRVGTALKHWIVSQFDDFTSEMISTLSSFINELKETENRSTLGEALFSILDKKIREKQKRILIYPPVPPSLGPVTHSPTPNYLLQFRAEDIAQQITLLDFEQFQSIKASELLELRWSRASQKHLAHHVCGSLDRLNMLAHYVPTTLVLLPSHEQRVEMLEKWIEIAAQLRNIQNYQALMGVFVGLNQASCQRMKKMWGELSNEAKRFVGEMEEILSPSNSYKRYRGILNSGVAPLCPYLGLFLSDLVAIDSGNPDKIRDEVNFTKLELIYRVIEQIRAYQVASYPFEEMEPLRSFFIALSPMSESQLFDCSLWREKKVKRK